MSDKIGDVTDLVIDPNGNVAMAILGVGGFLGVGQKDVAIPFKDLKISSYGRQKATRQICADIFLTTAQKRRA